MGAPPARATRGQREEEEVPGLRLGHPIGHYVEVLAQQPLAEEEGRCARRPSHCLGTHLRFRATSGLGTAEASLTPWLIPGALGTAWVSMDGKSV